MFGAVTGMGRGGQVDHTAADCSVHHPRCLRHPWWWHLSLPSLPDAPLMSSMPAPSATTTTGSDFYRHRWSHRRHWCRAPLGGPGCHHDLLPAFRPERHLYLRLLDSFQLGGVIGGLVSFVLNYHQTGPSVNDGTYSSYQFNYSTV
ncbi:unnamed protein product [Victoria cruziana]